jgi:methionyl-tRNA synthetase
VLTNKYYEGLVPAQNALEDYDKNVLSYLESCGGKVGVCIENYKMRDALSEVLNIARLGNKYLADTEPWKLKKTDEKRTETILNIALQISASLTVYLQPFLPFAAKQLSEMLNVDFSTWDQNKMLEKGHKINTSALLFAKIEDEKIEQQLNKLK